MTYLILLNDGTWFEKTNRMGFPGEMRVLAETQAIFVSPVEAAEALVPYLCYAPRVVLVAIDHRAGLAIYREKP